MITRGEISDVVLIESVRHGDHRGWFCETFSEASVESLGWPRFVQDNESLSSRAGTVRGLHFQRSPFAQAKFVRCIRGSILDVAVDIRPTSPTFKRHIAVTLSERSPRSMYIPAGFAHGFCTLESDTIVQYKVSAPYSPAHEAGIVWDDPALSIAWPFSASNVTISERDRKLPAFAEAIA